MPTHIVVADANASRQRTITERLACWKLPHSIATTEDGLWGEISRGKNTIVLLGLDDSHSVLEKLNRQGYHSVVLLLAPDADVHVAAQAIKQGAHDAFSDPIDYVCLRQSIEELRPKSDKANQSDAISDIPRMIGQSRSFQAVQQQIREVAATNATVLILGESGTGKELVAREIHNQSNRSAGPYLPVNMAALPESLAEGALFGHRRGAFTGADRDQQGWCEGAHGGTLFLDEIGELDLGLQAKLLRFLESKTFQRIGATQTTRVDVRILAATNRDPMEMIRNGTLRSDLYYRLNVFPIQLPTLWQRSEDIPDLANLFLDQARHQYAKNVSGFTKRAMQCLQQFDWPGNIRQLENTVHRVVISSNSLQIDLPQLPPEIVSSNARLDRPTNLRKIEQIERKAIIDALRAADGNAVSAAKILGVGQATVYRKMKRYGIPLKVQRRTVEASTLVE